MQDALRRAGVDRRKPSQYKTFPCAPIAQLDRASDYESAEGGNSDRDAPITAENFSMCVGALLVAVGRSRRLFTDRTRTVTGSLAGWTGGPSPLSPNEAILVEVRVSRTAFTCVPARAEDTSGAVLA
jgi:hypothetical protein